jgi:hypothetical protein
MVYGVCCIGEERVTFYAQVAFHVPEELLAQATCSAEDSEGCARDFQSSKSMPLDFPGGY